MGSEVSPKFYINSKYYKIIIINYNNSYPVYHLKLEISKEIGVRPSFQNLYYKGKLLDSNNPISYYNIPNNAHIILEPDIESFIYVNYLDQEKVHIEYFKLNNTVRELKYLIESKINISYSRQRLFYQGKELEDNLTLMDYDLYKQQNYLCLDIIIGDKNGVIVGINKKNNDILKFSFRAETKIIDIKYIIFEFTDLMPDMQILSIQNQQLKNELTLRDYNIYNEAILDLECKSKNGIILFIKRQFDRRAIYVDVPIKKKISYIKKLCKKKYNLPIENQKLIYNEIELDNDKTVSYYDIKPEANLSLIFQCYKKEDGFTLFVKTLTGKTISLHNIRPIWAIKNLKELISKNENIPFHELRLIFAGLQLEDNKLIKEYNIQEESTIHTVLRLVGG